MGGLGPRALHQELTSNVLSTETPSGASQIVLNRHDLRKLFAGDPVSELPWLRLLPCLVDQQLWHGLLTVPQQ